MKFKKWILLLQIAALLLLIGYPQNAYACSCEGPDPNLDAVEQVEASLAESYHRTAFVGTVIDVYRTEAVEGEYNEDPVYVTFSVEHVLKGDLSSEVVITTGPDDGLCGYNFVPGKTYLAYLNESWDSGLCSGNILEPSAELIAALNTSLPSEDGDRGVKLPVSAEPTSAPIEPSPEVPTIDTPAEESTGGVSSSLIRTVLLGLVLGLAAAWFRRSRKSS